MFCWGWCCQQSFWTNIMHSLGRNSWLICFFFFKAFHPLVKVWLDPELSRLKCFVWAQSELFLNEEIQKKATWRGFLSQSMCYNVPSQVRLLFLVQLLPLAFSDRTNNALPSEPFQKSFFHSVPQRHGSVCYQHISRVPILWHLSAHFLFLVSIFCFTVSESDFFSSCMYIVDLRERVHLLEDPLWSEMQK